MNLLVVAWLDPARIAPIWLYAGAFGYGAFAASPMILKELVTRAKRVRREGQTIPAYLWALIVVQASAVLTVLSVVAWRVRSR